MKEKYLEGMKNFTSSIFKSYYHYFYTVVDLKENMVRGVKIINRVQCLDYHIHHEKNLILNYRINFV